MSSRADDIARRAEIARRRRVIQPGSVSPSILSSPSPSTTSTRTASPGQLKHRAGSPRLGNDRPIISSKAEIMQAKQKIAMVNQHQSTPIKPTNQKSISNISAVSENKEKKEEEKIQNEGQSLSSEPLETTTNNEENNNGIQQPNEMENKFMQIRSKATEALLSSIALLEKSRKSSRRSSTNVANNNGKFSSSEIIDSSNKILNEIDSEKMVKHSRLAAYMQRSKSAELVKSEPETIIDIKPEPNIEKIKNVFRSLSSQEKEEIFCEENYITKINEQLIHFDYVDRDVTQEYVYEEKNDESKGLKQYVLKVSQKEPKKFVMSAEKLSQLETELYGNNVGVRTLSETEQQAIVMAEALPLTQALISFEKLLDEEMELDKKTDALGFSKYQNEKDISTFEERAENLSKLMKQSIEARKNKEIEEFLSKTKKSEDLNDESTEKELEQVIFKKLPYLMPENEKKDLINYSKFSKIYKKCCDSLIEKITPYSQLTDDIKNIEENELNVYPNNIKEISNRMGVCSECNIMDLGGALSSLLSIPNAKNTAMQISSTGRFLYIALCPESALYKFTSTIIIVLYLGSFDSIKLIKNSDQSINKIGSNNINPLSESMLSTSLSMFGSSALEKQDLLSYGFDTYFCNETVKDNDILKNEVKQNMPVISYDDDLIFRIVCLLEVPSKVSCIQTSIKGEGNLLVGCENGILATFDITPNIDIYLAALYTWRRFSSSELKKNKNGNDELNKTSAPKDILLNIINKAYIKLFEQDGANKISSEKLAKPYINDIEAFNDVIEMKKSNIELENDENDEELIIHKYNNNKETFRGSYIKIADNFTSRVFNNATRWPFSVMTQNSASSYNYLIALSLNSINLAHLTNLIQPSSIGGCNNMKNIRQEFANLDDAIITKQKSSLDKIKISISPYINIWDTVISDKINKEAIIADENSQYHDISLSSTPIENINSKIVLPSDTELSFQTSSSCIGTNNYNSICSFGKSRMKNNPDDGKYVSVLSDNSYIISYTPANLVNELTKQNFINDLTPLTLRLFENNLITVSTIVRQYKIDSVWTASLQNVIKNNNYYTNNTKINQMSLRELWNRTDEFNPLYCKSSIGILAGTIKGDLVFIPTKDINKIPNNQHDFENDMAYLVQADGFTVTENEIEKILNLPLSFRRRWIQKVIINENNGEKKIIEKPTYPFNSIFTNKNIVLTEKDPVAEIEKTDTRLICFLQENKSFNSVITAIITIVDPVLVPSNAFIVVGASLNGSIKAWLVSQPRAGLYLFGKRTSALEDSGVASKVALQDSFGESELVFDTSLNEDVVTGLAHGFVPSWVEGGIVYKSVLAASTLTGKLILWDLQKLINLSSSSGESEKNCMFCPIIQTGMKNVKHIKFTPNGELLYETQIDGRTAIAKLDLKW